MRHERNLPRFSEVDDTTIAHLKGEIRGDVIPPGDERYEGARKVYNAMIDRRPAVIIRCADVADVIIAVKVAGRENLPLAIRGGGHSVPGFGTADNAIVVDLGRMKGVRVDPSLKTAWAEGGCTWGDFNHATHAFGLATTGGIISTTGIAGLTLGGGIGYLTRGAGLSVDNLVSADVVLADGSFVTANEKSHPDLFWALRGGGGNFGVVTSFQYKLQPVNEIIGGAMLFEVGDAPKVMREYNEYITNAPRKLGAFFAWQIAPPLPFIPQNRHGDTFCAMVVCWAGPPDEGAKAIDPFRKAAHVVAEFVGPMPYPAMNSLFDGLVPPGLQHYWKAVYVKDLTDATIEAHMKFGPKIPVVNSTMHIYPINGAPQDVPSEATAFGHREAKYATVIAGMWPDPKQNEANIRWVRDYYNALAPYSEQGGYINFAAPDDDNRTAANFGSNFEKLRKIKAKYDPNNRFRINQNIPPAS
jgi:FAD/FMN-containing dehydrogenase